MAKLQKAVLAQLGIDSIGENEKCVLEGIANHGIDGGFNGFIYYNETIKFFDDNRELILQSLSEDANDYGIASADMVSGFGCLHGNDWRVEIDSVLMNIDNCDDCISIKNALAWYAAEKVAGQLTDQ